MKKYTVINYILKLLKSNISFVLCLLLFCPVIILSQSMRVDNMFIAGLQPDRLSSSLPSKDSDSDDSNATAYSREESTTWYSYMDGDWVEPHSWTKTQGYFDNPDEEIPDINDNVIITDNKRVTVNTDNITVASLEVFSGRLILGATSGHNFNVITGKGMIKLSAENFPDGDATDFKGSNGGTVKYYGDSFTISQPRTFNNMVVEMNNNHTLTLLTDYILNGNLTVDKGNFRINDDTEADILNLTINGNLTVNNNGKLSVGEGDTREGYQIQGGSLPALGEYHSIFHQVILYGDFSNQGVVSFTNQNAPDFREFAQNGGAVFTFAGTQNQNVELKGTTDFYNIIIDKGSDNTHVVHINSYHEDNFALYGPNNLANNTGGGFTEENPEIRKAVWIRNGTLRISGAVHIPSLTEGNEYGSRGDFTVPTTGKLWIDGASITVYTTIHTHEQRPPGTDWHKAASGHTAFTLFGTFRIDAGFFGTRHSAGFIYRDEDAATVKIYGGIIDAASFRSSYAGGGGRTYYYQSGGQVRVRGNRTYAGEVGGEISGAYPAFGIISSDGIFNMEGGEILMIGKSRNDDNNAYGNNGFYIVSDDYSVTGGSIRLLLQGGDNYFVHSTANLWNLQMERYGGSGNIDVRFTCDLTVSNNLLISDYCTLHPRRAEGQTIYDLNIGRNFTLGNSSNSNAGYEGYHGNKTRFFGDNNAELIIANNEDSPALNFYTLEIDKSSQETKITLVSEGRSPADVETTPYQSPIEIHNRLFVKNGTLDYNSFSIVLGDHDEELENRGTIGLIDDTGFLAMSSGSEQNITTPFGTNPLFGRLVLNNDDKVAFTGNAVNITIGDLHMRRGILDIGNHGITVENEIDNIDGGGSFENFGENKMIRINGKHSDGGVKRKITENNKTYLFPLGIDTKTGDGNRYTPAEPEFTGVTQPGYVQINNVDRELPTLHPGEGERALQYYWRIRHDGFDEADLPIVKHTFIFYDTPDSYVEGAPNPNSFKEGKVVGLDRKYDLGHSSYNNTTSKLTLEFWDKNTNGNPPGLSPIETGEFTAAHQNRFAGTLEIFFSRDGGLSGDQSTWNNRHSWTTLTILKDHLGVDDPPKDEWHRSTNPPAERAPQQGDVVVIGWVPHDDLESAGDPGYPHTVRINNFDVRAAWLIFNQMLDENGDPTERKYRDSYMFRPTLTVNNNSYDIDIPVIEGEGLIRFRMAAAGSEHDFLTISDAGDFAREDSAYVVYEVFNNGTEIQNMPRQLPNVFIASDEWGNGNKYASFIKDLHILGNLEVRGNFNLRLHDDTQGDIYIGRDLVLGQAIRSETGTRYTNTRLSFPNSGHARQIDVLGNILAGDITQGDDIASIFVLNPSTDGPLTHKINLYGSYIQGANTGHSEANGINLRFFTGADEDRVLLNLLGKESMSFDILSGTPADLYRLIADKGSSPETEAQINGHITLGGATDGNSDEKALYIINGKLILDHEDNDITITSGGEPFVIPSTAGLVVSDGKITAAGSNVNLRGLLRIENDGKAFIENTIQYATTGHSALQITDNGELEVGGQVRSSVESQGGVLKYSQSGGTVTIGTVNPDAGSRGVFEILNPGSEFLLTGGELTIAQSQGGSPARAAFYLRPTIYSTHHNAIINIGSSATISDVIELDVAPGIMLPTLNITQGTDVTARLRNNNLTVNGNLEIGNDNFFDGNEKHLTVNRDIYNYSQPWLNTDSLILGGSEQFIEGSLDLNHLVVNSSTSVTLSDVINTVIETAGNLYMNSGTLYDEGNTITALADVYNYATFHSNNSTEGGVKFTGDENQYIYGNGKFGRVEILKDEGTFTLQGPMEIENNLVLTNGNFYIDRFKLTLGYDSEITGGEYGTDRMIVSRGIYEDQGLAKRISTGAGSFIFPVGRENKYTPVEIEYTSNTNPGIITVTPVDEAHMSITGGDPNHTLDILDYHWYVKSEGLENFEGNIHFHYDPEDINGDAAEYSAARLINYEWYIFPPEFVVEEEDYFFFEYTGVSDITGDYTAGQDEDIPPDVPLYISVTSGPWEEGNNWRHSVDNSPASSGGPSGVRVQIEPGHTITVNEIRKFAYELDLYGTLDIGETYGHNFRDFKGNGTFIIESNTLPANRFDVFYSTPGSTMVYGGKGGYTITDRYLSFQNLTITGNGQNGSIEFPDNPININRIFQILEESKLEAINDINLYGESFIKENNAGFISHSWTYFRGTGGLQSLFGNFTGNNSFNKLYIWNSSGVFFDGDADISNLLYLRDGVLTVSEGHRVHLTGLQGLHQDSSLDQSWIDGRFARNLTSGSYSEGSYHNLFPVGKNNKRRFVRLNIIFPHNADWIAEYYDEPPSEAGLDPESFEDPPLTKVSDNEYWGIEGPSGGESQIQLNWGPASGVGTDLEDLESTVIAMWDDTDAQWVNRGGEAYFSDPEHKTGYVNSTIPSFFSERYFTIAADEEDNPLPVIWLTFQAEVVDGKVHLQWATASETNNAYFTVERSRDGRDFRSIKNGKVPSKAEYGYSNSVLFYEIWDENPMEGVSYYRLKQTDIDGSYEYSKIVSVKIRTESYATLKLFPNPNQGERFYLSLNGFEPYEIIYISIVNVIGTKLFRDVVNAGHDGNYLHEIKLNNLDKGIYFVICNTKSGRNSIRMVVQ